MTPAQNSRILGFNASLKARGVTLSLCPSGRQFQALIEPAASLKLRKTQPVTNELVTDIIHAKRDAIAAIETSLGPIRAGAGFSDPLTNRLFRVHERHDDSANVASIEFHCQASTLQ